MEKPKTLAIRGKVINIEKIGEKTVAQFGAQLRQNGIELEAEELAALHAQLTKTDEQKQAERDAAKAEAEVKAAQIRKEFEAKFNAK